MIFKPPSKRKCDKPPAKTKIEPPIEQVCDLIYLFA